MASPTEPDSAQTSPQWPARRGSEAAIRARFGPDIAARLAAALRTRDPLADAVVAEMRAGNRDVARQLRNGINHGLATVPHPTPAVAALLSQTETRPPNADTTPTASGSLPFFSAPPVLQQIALAVGSLVNVYASPSIAIVLGGTGRLIDGTPRRVLETGKWLFDAMLPDSLRPGRSGYIATLEVRMLHANIRWAQTQHGFATDSYGTPINQVDLARTWLDFTYTPYAALQRLGVACTDDEIAEVYRHWWQLAHLLGVDADLYLDVCDQHSGARNLERFNATNEAANETSAQLTDVVLTFVAGILTERTRMRPRLARSTVNALARRIHGHHAADALRIAHSPMTALLPALAWTLRRLRARRRRNAGAWAAGIAANMDAARALLSAPDEPTTYQTNLVAQ